MDVLETKLGFDELSILNIFSSADFYKLDKKTLSGMIRDVNQQTKQCFVPNKDSNELETQWNEVDGETFNTYIDAAVNMHKLARPDATNHLISLVKSLMAFSQVELTKKGESTL